LSIPIPIGEQYSQTLLPVPPGVVFVVLTLCG
jgi:hypothetical protein